jgi:hypothetical protein
VEDEEAHGGAAGEQAGSEDGKIDEDVRILGEKSAQHHEEDGKRATEGVNNCCCEKSQNLRVPENVPV